MDLDACLVSFLTRGPLNPSSSVYVKGILKLFQTCSRALVPQREEGKEGGWKRFWTEYVMAVGSWTFLLLNRACQSTPGDGDIVGGSC